MRLRIIYWAEHTACPMHWLILCVLMCGCRMNPAPSQEPARHWPLWFISLMWKTGFDWQKEHRVNNSYLRPSSVILEHSWLSPCFESMLVLSFLPYVGPSHLSSYTSWAQGNLHFSLAAPQTSFCGNIIDWTSYEKTLPGFLEVLYFLTWKVLTELPSLLAFPGDAPHYDWTELDLWGFSRHFQNYCLSARLSTALLCLFNLLKC